jgi:hypothetical protein
LVRVITSTHHLEFSHPDALVLSGNSIWVANAYSNPDEPSVGASISEIATSTGLLIRTLGNNGHHFDDPDALAVSGSDLFVANGIDLSAKPALTELNDTTGALVRVISGAAYDLLNPGAFAVVNGELFVANYGGIANAGIVTDYRSYAVSEISTSTGKLVHGLNGSAYQFNYPDALAIAGSELFVTNEVGSSVTAFSVA